MARHGSVRSSEIAAALSRTPSCPKLAGYWRFYDCRYHKGSDTCSEPGHIEACPLPRHPLRNGRLNQMAYSLFLFMRDLRADRRVPRRIFPQQDPLHVGLRAVSHRQRLGWRIGAIHYYGGVPGNGQCRLCINLPDRCSRGMLRAQPVPDARNSPNENLGAGGGKGVIGNLARQAGCWAERLRIFFHYSFRTRSWRDPLAAVSSGTSRVRCVAVLLNRQQSLAVRTQLVCHRRCSE